MSFDSQPSLNYLSGMIKVIAEVTKSSSKNKDNAADGNKSAIQAKGIYLHVFANKKDLYNPENSSHCNKTMIDSFRKESMTYLKQNGIKVLGNSINFDETSALDPLDTTAVFKKLFAKYDKLASQSGGVCAGLCG
ncbi:MAG: hypothetical protein MHPSP_001632 [Paramarteilia canceri]